MARLDGLPTGAWQAGHMTSNLRQAQRALGHQCLETTVAHDVLDALQPGLTDGRY
jgi:hypothetical protein